MIDFTPAEFHQVREAVALAHVLIQSLAPTLKERHTYLNREQRQLVKAAPETFSRAFNLIAKITHRTNRDPEQLEAAAPTKLSEIDVTAMRDELENVSALQLPDLLNEMKATLAELPMFNDLVESSPLTSNHVAQLMAWTWEAGRRYGVQQGMVVIESSMNDYIVSLNAILDAALNGTLDLPSVEKKMTPGSESPDGAAPAPLDATGETRSPGAALDGSGPTLITNKTN